MKAQIHPKWYPNAKVTCACGNTFTVGSTQPEITVEICSNCHPFYTGKMTLVDTAGRVEAFKAKQSIKSSKPVSKKQKRLLRRAKKIKEQQERPRSLEELRSKK